MGIRRSVRKREEKALEWHHPQMRSHDSENQTDRSPLEPGQVWWCDGVALSFDPYYKRRPILIVAVEEDGTLVVIPLSSRRHFGQETAVVHARGTSYMTGVWIRVGPDSLVKPLGEWPDFAGWEAEQRQAVSSGSFSWLRTIRDRLRRLLGLPPTFSDIPADGDQKHDFRQ
jgi:hypothetical protein